MKIIDGFLKMLKTDRNTFVAYILTLLTIYFTIDRIVEILIMGITGLGCSYWGPIKYALAFACPIFAFLFSCSSKLVKTDDAKLSFFYLYVVTLYIMIISMFTQMINAGAWMLFLSSPAYPKVAVEYSNLIAPAFRSISIYLPLTTFYPVIKWLYGTVNDSPDMKESIYSYSGISLSKKSEANTGDFSTEIKLCVDKVSGKTIKISEDKRFESMLVVGVSGSGKTSLIFEPMIARDIEKKYFYKKNAKEFGFAALKAGIAYLDCPYDSDYVNENFSLNMIKAKSSKDDTFKSCMKKMIKGIDNGNIIYKDLGLTYISPDFESTSRILKVANNYHVKVNLIDPNSEDSPGLNPFAYESPLRTSVVISTVLKGLNSFHRPDVDPNLGYQDNFSTQAIENLAILLKLTYPKMHNGTLPTLEDMLDAFNDFKLIRDMCDFLKQDKKSAEKNKTLLAYFKKHFYKNGDNLSDTEKYISAAATQLDNLLRSPGIKNILCNRTNNIDFDKSLANGEFNLLCTRRGDLGNASHKAFGLFFLLSMQYAVLRRPGIEGTRIPHYLYIDEFSDFICAATEPIFTLYRKYRIGTVISVQNLDQLNVFNKQYRKTIIANCAHKIVFGNNEPEDNEWWSKELGEKNKWEYSRAYDTEKGEYKKDLGNIKLAKVAKYKAGKFQAIKFKQCFYKVRESNGKNTVGIGMLDFIESKYKEKQPVIKMNFAKYTPDTSDDEKEKQAKQKKKFIHKIPSFAASDFEDEVDPIRTSIYDSIFDSNDEGNAIIDNKKKPVKKNTNNDDTTEINDTDEV